MMRSEKAKVKSENRSPLAVAPGHSGEGNAEAEQRRRVLSPIEEGMIGRVKRTIRGDVPRNKHGVRQWSLSPFEGGKRRRRRGMIREDSMPGSSHEHESTLREASPRSKRSSRSLIAPSKGNLTIAVALMVALFLGSLTTSVYAQGYEPLRNTPQNEPGTSGSFISPQGETVYPQLEKYLRIASEENPELRALWHQYRADQEIIPQVGTLPDPEINIGYTFNPMMSDPFLGRFSVSAMQMFPWFGTLQTRRDMQRASAETGYHRLNSRQLMIYRELQSTWFDLAELNRQISIARETIQLVRDLEALVEVRYETARAGQADLLRIQMEEQRLQTLIENLEDKLNPIRAKFNAYLNRDPVAEL
jgi:outer membrane protein, heavy metal efflux system